MNFLRGGENMGKIAEGRFELFTTKEDAIDKLRQLQGCCREEIGDGQPIVFYCTKKGRISISDPPSKYAENDCSTSLYGSVVERDGKVYVEYYTVYSHLNNVLKIIGIAMLIIMSLFSLASVVLDFTRNKPYIIFVFICAFFVFQLISTLKEKSNAPNDSRKMIEELEKRVEAVNLWDK